MLPFSSLKAASPALAHPSKRHGVVTLTAEEFKYGFVNTFSPEDAAAAYERYAVPETGRIFFEAGFANFTLHPPTEVHFKSDDRAPLLIVGAEQDHTVPASVAKEQHKKYERSPAQTDYLEFPGGRTCSIVGEGWEEVAQHSGRRGLDRVAGGRCGGEADGPRARGARSPSSPEPARASASPSRGRSPRRARTSSPARAPTEPGRASTA